MLDIAFVEGAERTLSLPWRGSRNQRVIDVQASLAAGSEVVRPD